MVRWTTSVTLALALAAAPASARQAAPATCAGLAECRAQTEAAIAEGDYERAHDLAWRATAQGPRNDRSLMFLLARTQVLSGRPGDALVMVRRIAETGTAVDVSADEFLRMRELPGWPDVEAVIAGKASAAVTAPESANAPKAPEAPRRPGTQGTCRTRGTHLGT